MNYIDEIAEEIRVRRQTRSPIELLRLYAALVLIKGAETTLEDVHDMWAVWRTASRPDHPDLIPFTDLPEDVRELDVPYRDVIREIASERAGR